MIFCELCTPPRNLRFQSSGRPLRSMPAGRLNASTSRCADMRAPMMDEEPVIEIVAFDSTTWELAVNDPSRANMHLLHGLGGKWVLVNERGEAQAPADA